MTDPRPMPDAPMPDAPIEDFVAFMQSIRPAQLALLQHVFNPEQIAYLSTWFAAQIDRNGDPGDAEIGIATAILRRVCADKIVRHESFQIIGGDGLESWRFVGYLDPEDASRNSDRWCRSYGDSESDRYSSADALSAVREAARFVT